jgi:glycosyltransferase involved in cell wall biosynthesis
MWDRTNEYKKEIGWNSGIKKIILNWMLKSLRMWDFAASQRHDITLANSSNVVKRLKKYYKLDAEVVYPNVEVNRFTKEISEVFTLPFQKNDYYIIISALTEFKRIDRSILAFNQMPDKNLIIV